jgi:hypothetical protein
VLEVPEGQGLDTEFNAGIDPAAVDRELEYRTGIPTISTLVPQLAAVKAAGMRSWSSPGRRSTPTKTWPPR